MHFKPPGGKLSLLSICWILFAFSTIYAAIFEPTKSSYILIGLATTMGLCGMGLWFQQRWCAKVMIIFFILCFLLAIFVMYHKGFKAKYLFKTAMMVYTIKLMKEWLDKTE